MNVLNWMTIYSVHHRGLNTAFFCKCVELNSNFFFFLVEKNVRTIKKKMLFVCIFTKNKVGLNYSCSGKIYFFIIGPNLLSIC